MCSGCLEFPFEIWGWRLILVFCLVLGWPVYLCFGGCWVVLGVAGCVGRLVPGWRVAVCTVLILGWVALIRYFIHFWLVCLLAYSSLLVVCTYLHNCKCIASILVFVLVISYSNSLFGLFPTPTSLPLISTYSPLLYSPTGSLCPSCTSISSILDYYSPFSMFLSLLLSMSIYTHFHS